MDKSEYLVKLEGIRKSIFEKIDKSLEHNDSHITVEWLVALEKVEERIFNAKLRVRNE